MFATQTIYLLTFQRHKSRADPALPSLGVSLSSTCYGGNPLQDTSPVSRTRSSFPSICSITCTLPKVVKQEACSSGFAAIYITSERLLEILSGPHLSQPKKPRLKGEGAPGLGEEGRSCLGSCLHGIPYTQALHVLRLGLVNISSYISTCFSLRSHGDMDRGHPTADVGGYLSCQQWGAAPPCPAASAWPLHRSEPWGCRQWLCRVVFLKKP